MYEWLLQLLVYCRSRDDRGEARRISAAARRPAGGGRRHCGARPLPRRRRRRGRDWGDLRDADPCGPAPPPHRPPPHHPVPLLRPRLLRVGDLLQHRRAGEHPPGQRVPSRRRALPRPHPFPAVQPHLDLRRRRRLRVSEISVGTDWISSDLLFRTHFDFFFEFSFICVAY